jgi:hypothetical protein
MERHFDPPTFKPWHRVMVDTGQTEEEAIAAYEAENGLLRDDCYFIVRVIEPGSAPPPAHTES